MEEAVSLYENDSAIVPGKDGEYITTGKTILIFKTSDEATIDISTQNCSESQNIKGCSLFFFDRRIRIHVLNSHCYCRKIRLESIANLLVFMDAASGISEYSYSDFHWGYLTKGLGPEHFDNGKKVKTWLIINYIKKEESIQPFLNFIRASEEYQIVSFLLKKTVWSSDINSIKNLCKEYGLSYSHFRRLCYKALGKPVKEELEKWKVMNAYFDCVEHNDSLTFHALNNGFSSSSHFSNAVKKFTGYSPNDLKKVNFLKKMAEKND